MAVTDTDKNAAAAVVLDYLTADAIGLLANESLERKNHMAFLTVNDPDKQRRIGYATNRMTLGTKNGNAGLIINSPDGKPM